MKIYTWNDETYTSIPNPLILADGSSISPVSEAVFIANGGTVEENGEPTHYEELCDSCDTFIEVVLEIAEKIGDASFMGGINQQAMLRDSQYAKDNPTDALTLAERWNGADKACNFYADRLAVCYFTNCNIHSNRQFIYINCQIYLFAFVFR